jgi:1,4-dihydroxy-2-naphthoate octaprenyltransferase
MNEYNLWVRWKAIHQTANPLPGAPLDTISKWMLITRSYVFEMNIYAGMVGILLALQFVTETTSLMYYEGAIIIVGLILAHAANNMMNDFFDTLHGVDTKGYPRTEYGPHALIDNLISTKGLILAIFLCNLIDLIIAIYFYQKVGLEILYFVFAGLGISIFYVAKPIRLKNLGLGEFAIGLVFGPLMVGGTFMALTGESFGTAALNNAFLVSIPFGLTSMTVVMGKHMDKYEADTAKPVHTLPVIIGMNWASKVCQFTIISFFIFSLLSVVEGHYAMAVVVFAIPRAIYVIQKLNDPIPNTQKEAFDIAFEALPPHLKEKVVEQDMEDIFPVWPLWYVAWAFHFVKIAGAMFVLGLIIDTLIALGLIPL